MQPRFSLITVTMSGREHLLRECLASMDRQHFRRFQAIIVDQASDPRIRELVEAYPWAHYIPAPPDGLSASRNRGLAHASGPLIAFPDDDAILAPDMLDLADRLFSTFPELGLLAGSAIDPVTKRRIFRFPDTPASLTVWNVMHRHCASTIFVRRQALEQAQGYFDPMLGVGTKTEFGASEETDLVFRLLLSGVVGRYEPDVLIFHPNTELVAIPREKAIRYSVGLGACFRKSRERFGWWPIGALWCWLLVRSCGGVVLDALSGRVAHSRQRIVSILARLRGWSLYGNWLADSRGGAAATDADIE